MKTFRVTIKDSEDEICVRIQALNKTLALAEIAHSFYIDQPNSTVIIEHDEVGYDELFI